MCCFPSQHSCYHRFCSILLQLLASLSNKSNLISFCPGTGLQVTDGNARGRYEALSNFQPCGKWVIIVWVVGQAKFDGTSLYQIMRLPDNFHRRNGVVFRRVQAVPWTSHSTQACHGQNSDLQIPLVSRDWSFEPGHLLFKANSRSFSCAHSLPVQWGHVCQIMGIHWCLLIGWVMQQKGELF